VLESPIVDYLRTHGASFFAQIHAAVGGFPNELIDQIWELVWRGVLTNDTFQALRAFTRGKSAERRIATARASVRSRREAPATTQGRSSLVESLMRHSGVEQANAWPSTALTLWRRHPRNAAWNRLPVASARSPILKAMEEAGRARRGYFVAGLGATQFATAGALDLLRSFRDAPAQAEVVLLAATDPANPYGALVKWPEPGLQRAAGASVILVNGALAAHLGRGDRQLSIFLPEAEPERSTVARSIAARLATILSEGTRRALLITSINDEPAARSPLAPYLAGWVCSTGMGYQNCARRPCFWAESGGCDGSTRPRAASVTGSVKSVHGDVLPIPDPPEMRVLQEFAVRPIPRPWRDQGHQTKEGARGRRLFGRGT
jgi:ATP-dependent Lhr-like helicase